MRPNHNGFTLIEVLACVTIVGMMAAVASRSLHTAQQRVAFDDVVERLVDYEQLTRAQARRQGQRAALVYHVTDVEQRIFSSDEYAAGLRMPFRLPSGFLIERIFQVVNNNEGWRIEISRHGRSRSYAVLLAAPEKKRQWIVFCGMTGQPIRLENEQEAQDIMAVLAKRRLDAD